MNHKKDTKFSVVSRIAKALSASSFERGAGQVDWRGNVVPDGWNKLANKFTVRRDGNYYVVWTSHRQRGFVPVATMHESGITGTNMLPKKFAIAASLSHNTIGDQEGDRVREAISLALRKHANYEIFKLYNMFRSNAENAERHAALTAQRVVELDKMPA